MHEDQNDERAGRVLAADLDRYDRADPGWRERGTTQIMEEASTRHGEEYFWLGDGSGFTVEANIDPYARRPYVFLAHRCGWSVGLFGAQNHLSNFIADHVRPHLAAGCRELT